MNFIYAFRYFHVVKVVPSLYVSGFVVAVAAAAARLTFDPLSAVDALTPVLLLHMFAASSGFRIPARRGYYDLLLTSGARRWEIAAAHWVASVVPGLTSWICVGMLELAANHGGRSVSAASGTSAAFLLVSLIAWAVATPLPRGTAAIGWLLVMSIPPAARFVSPVRLLGLHLAGLPAWQAITIAMCGLVPAAVAFAHIVRDGIPLEAAQ